jgi:hypothetical protein
MNRRGSFFVIEARWMSKHGSNFESFIVEAYELDNALRAANQFWAGKFNMENREGLEFCETKHIGAILITDNGKDGE